MSETSILPGAAPADSGLDIAPPGTGPADDGEGGGDRRRLLVLVGAVFGVIILGAAAFLLLHKGGSSSDNSTFVPHSITPAGSTPNGTTPTKAPSGSGNNSGHQPKTLPKKAKNNNVRDPFKALVLAPVDTSGGAQSTTTVTPASTEPTAPDTQPTAPVDTNPSTAPSSTPPSTSTHGSGKTSGPPLWLQLMGVHGQKATFKVGYSHHKFRKFVVGAPEATDAAGTVFDKVFALIGVQNGQATVQIGDDTPFDLTKGVSHVV
jgi:hypothetical protein